MRAPSASVYQASRNLSVRCVLTSCKLGPGYRLPAPNERSTRPCPRIKAVLRSRYEANGPSPSYRTRREVRALPIVHDEFRPAIPRRVARQHCPSPLHRRSQNKSIALANGRNYHRLVSSLLTVCLNRGDNPNSYLVPIVITLPLSTVFGFLN